MEKKVRSRGDRSDCHSQYVFSLLLYLSSFFDIKYWWQIQLMPREQCTVPCDIFCIQIENNAKPLSRYIGLNIIIRISLKNSTVIDSALVRMLLNKGLNYTHCLYTYLLNHFKFLLAPVCVRSSLSRVHSITTWTRWGEGVKKCMFLSTLRV